MRFEPSSFWAVAHSVRPLLFGPVRMTLLEYRPLPVMLPPTFNELDEQAMQLYPW